MLFAFLALFLFFTVDASPTRCQIACAPCEMLNCTMGYRLVIPPQPLCGCACPYCEPIEPITTTTQSPTCPYCRCARPQCPRGAHLVVPLRTTPSPNGKCTCGCPYCAPNC
ncbi:hypothetical protein QR680_015183 [Steinernema hermaphroditum]|uniref:Antistasin-like domain-containing protein n=1 Tax=Steinernema hermaphroditum TaxID=289476 RepID=A0AA39IDM9_9BILA|nr:hypothetical protein QR680_015183 [Steinernema hermaphroditum]